MQLFKLERFLSWQELQLSLLHSIQSHFHNCSFSLALYCSEKISYCQVLSFLTVRNTSHTQIIGLVFSLIKCSNYNGDFCMYQHHCSNQSILKLGKWCRHYHFLLIFHAVFTFSYILIAFFTLLISNSSLFFLLMTLPLKHFFGN